MSWQGAYVLDRAPSLCPGTVERRLIPLFLGGTFDADFNGAEDRRPVSLATPEGMERAFIEAVITGHLLCSSCCMISAHQTSLCPPSASAACLVRLLLLQHDGMGFCRACYGWCLPDRQLHVVQMIDTLIL